MPAGKFSNTFNCLSHNLMVCKQNKVVNVGVTLRLLDMLPMKKKKKKYCLKYASISSHLTMWGRDLVV